MTITTERSTTLERLAMILNGIQTPAHYTKPTDDVPFEKLIVALDDALNIETPIYLLNMYFVEDLLVPGGDLGAEYEAERTRTSTLQMYIEQTIELNPDKLLDTYRMLAILGRWIPVGGSLSLVENEEGSSLYYTYAMPTENKALNATWIMDILDTLQLFLTGFFPKIHAFQVSDQSIEDVIAKTQQEMQSMLKEGVQALQG